MPKNNISLAFNEEAKKKPRILVVPLDWGLGHATRCIPVIYGLLNQGADVWLAGEGAQENLLKTEFPGLPFLTLKGYRVKYSHSGPGLLFRLMLQTPRLLKAIREENRWLKEMVKKHSFDAVISDNRFGLYHSSIPSVFITHQLNIKSPLGKWSESLLQKRNYSFINRFTECWVPDGNNDKSFAGELSHPLKVPQIPIHYIGILSRLDPGTEVNVKKNHLFISLSGPEPQRTLLENKIIRDIAHYPYTATIVRGLPGNAKLIPSTNDIRFYNHLPAEEFNKEMAEAEWMICRSGYSTVMDIIRLGKKSIFIPTPGQPEQEYLAHYLQSRKIAPSINQKEFRLNKALEEMNGFDYRLGEVHADTALSQPIISLIKKLI